MKYCRICTYLYHASALYAIKMMNYLSVHQYLQPEESFKITAVAYLEDTCIRLDLHAMYCKKFYQDFLTAGIYKREPGFRNTCCR